MYFYLPPPAIFTQAPEVPSLQVSDPEIRLTQIQVERNRYGDTPRDLTEGRALARGAIRYMSSISRIEFIVQDFGQPDRVERTANACGGLAKPFTYYWIIKARHGTPIAEIRASFNGEDRFACGNIVRWLLQ